MVTVEEFNLSYLVKNGMPVTEEVLNKAPEQLKKEIKEVVDNLGTIQDFLTALE